MTTPRRGVLPPALIGGAFDRPREDAGGPGAENYGDRREKAQEDEEEVRGLGGDAGGESPYDRPVRAKDRKEVVVIGGDEGSGVEGGTSDVSRELLSTSWLGSYFDFHASSRRRYPGPSLFSDPSAPPPVDPTLRDRSESAELSLRRPQRPSLDSPPRPVACEPHRAVAPD